MARRLGQKGDGGGAEQQQNPEATPLLRLRLLDLDRPAAVEGRRAGNVSSGLLTLWRPDGQLAGLLEEGRVVGLANSQVGRQEGSTLHLTATRATQYLDIGRRPAAADLPAEAARTLVTASTVGGGGAGFRPAFNEVDVVVRVLAVGEARTGDFQPVYVGDRDGFFHTNKFGPESGYDFNLF